MRLAKAISGKVLYRKANGSNRDIRNVLENGQIMDIAVAQTKNIAKKFEGKTPKDTYFNIWKFLKNNIRYKEDGIEQQNIKLPSRLLRDGVGDCKSYSLFTAAILKNLGIPCYWTYASYNSNPTPQHVYITTSDNYIIDGVWNGFNSEKAPTHKKKKKVN